MRTLEGRIAVVTGGTEGVGRGIASELAYSGARVFVTGRSICEGALNGSQIRGIRCDHREDQQVAAAFERAAKESGAIDIVVNNVWGGYEQMMENGVFTWSEPFWEQPIWRWDAMFAAGVRPGQAGPFRKFCTLRPRFLATFAVMKGAFQRDAFTRPSGAERDPIEGSTIASSPPPSGQGPGSCSGGTILFVWSVLVNAGFVLGAAAAQEAPTINVSGIVPNKPGAAGQITPGIEVSVYGQLCVAKS